MGPLQKRRKEIASARKITVNGKKAAVADAGEYREAAAGKPTVGNHKVGAVPTPGPAASRVQEARAEIVGKSDNSREARIQMSGEMAAIERAKAFAHVALEVVRAHRKILDRHVERAEMKVGRGG